MKTRFLCLVALAFSAAHWLGGCGSDKPATVITPESSLPHYTAGEETLTVTTQIPVGGGSLIGPAGSPIEGITVTFPAGFASGPMTVSIGYENGTVTGLAAGSSAGATLVVHGDDTVALAKPYTITIPDPDTEHFPVFLFHVDGFNALKPATLVGEDAAAKTATFDMWHFSKFPRAALPASSDTNTDSGLETAFRPESHGFAISNSDPFKYHPKGACLGMALYSVDHFQIFGAGTWLHGQYIDAVPSVTGPTLMTQNVLASRAHGSVAKCQGYYADFTSREFSRGDRLRALLKAGQPVPVFFLAVGGAAHAGVVFGTSGSDFLIYNPNWPGVTARMVVQGQGGVQLLGGGGKENYAWWMFFGGGSLGGGQQEKFSFITRDVEANFHGENETKIEVTSHANKSTIRESEPTIKAKLNRGQVDITEVEVFYPDKDSQTGESSKLVTISEEQEEFEAKVRIYSGDNKIRFVTRGSPNGLTKVETPNTFDGKGDDRTFVLKGPPEYAGTFTFGEAASSGGTSTGFIGHGTAALLVNCDDSGPCFTAEGDVVVTVDSYVVNGNRCDSFQPASYTTRGSLFLDPVAMGGAKGQYTWWFGPAHWIASAICYDAHGQGSSVPAIPVSVSYVPQAAGSVPCAGGKFFRYTDAQSLIGQTDECLIGPVSWDLRLQ